MPHKRQSLVTLTPITSKQPKSSKQKSIKSNSKSNSKTKKIQRIPTPPSRLLTRTQKRQGWKPVKIESSNQPPTWRGPHETKLKSGPQNSKIYKDLYKEKEKEIRKIMIEFLINNDQFKVTKEAQNKNKDELKEYLETFDTLTLYSKFQPKAKIPGDPLGRYYSNSRFWYVLEILHEIINILLINKHNKESVAGKKRRKTKKRKKTL